MFRRFAFLGMLATSAGLVSVFDQPVALAQTVGAGCINCGPPRGHAVRPTSGTVVRPSGGASASVSAASIAGIPLAPGERIISISPIDSQGVVGAMVPVTADNHVVSHPQSHPQAANVSGSRGSSGSSNVLGMLNGQRARQGLSALNADPALQAVAERRAQQMASTGNKNHPPGSFAPGRYEGVGWSSSHSPSGVSACYTSDPRMQYAGAAMAVGRDGVYFAVVYR